MSQKQEFKNFFNGMQLDNFSAEELIPLFERTKNSIPPKELWDNCKRAFWIVQLVRDHFKKPLRVVSAYRSPAYNAKVRGAQKSKHLQFMALDIQVDGVSPVRVYNLLKKWRAAGVFRGGLGRYSTFVHIDTRGRNVSW